MILSQKMKVGRKERERERKKKKRNKQFWQYISTLLAGAVEYTDSTFAKE